MLPELNDCQLDHVAIAVNSIDEAQKIWQDLGLRFDGARETVLDQKVITSFAAIDVNAHLELLEPTDADSPIAKFIAKNGAGIHHLCFRVPDVAGKQAEMEAKGYRFIYPQARVGAGGCFVNFLHPKTTGGVLIEISTRRHA
jgi:methylmalonyl-CoA/ethylmalonyl-CoA epimerase